MRAIHSTVIALVLLSLAGPVATAHANGGLQWQPDLEAAKRAAADSNRLILVHCWAPWCDHCIRLEKTVFNQPAVSQAVQAGFVPVKINHDEFPQLVRSWGINSLPADLIVSPSGQVVAKLQVNGATTGEQYLAQLNRIPAQQPSAQEAYAQATRAPAQAAGQVPPSAAVNPYAGNPFSNQSAYTPPQMSAQMPAQAPVQPSQPAAPAAAAAATESAPWARGLAKNEFTPPAQSAPSQPGWTAQPSAPLAVQTMPPAAQQPPVAQQPSWSQMASAPAAQQPVAPQQQVAAQQPTAPPVQQPAAAGQQFGLDRHCPVTLVEQERWAAGDERFGAVHRGKVYLFSSHENQQKFLANPDGYSPVMSGNDPVLAISRGMAVPGRREFGMYFNKRVYLFADEATLKQFSESPDRFAEAVLQAERPRTGQMR